MCEYFENLENGDRNFEDVSGVYTLENMKALGRQKKLCPYFLAQRLIEEANIVVCNYPYLVDSRVSQVLYKRIGSDCIVIFDEAHNIDNICIDSLTVKLNKGILEGATFNWETIKQDVDKRVDMINENIQNEFKNLVDGLSAEERVRVTGLEAQEAVASKHIPGSIKKTEHFMSHLRLIITYLKNFIKIKDVRLLTPTEFLSEMCKQTVIDKAVFPFMELRYRLLMMSLQKTNLDELSTLSMICKFLSLLAENTDGFKIILEPYQDNTSVLDPLLQFCCLDSSIAMVPVFQKFKAVILTSGTISPLELYPQLLGFIPNVLRSIPAFLARNSISPMIVARGNDQVPITSEFSERGNQMVSRL